ncbi:MAG: hypothetical protein ACTSSG_08700 [Candidatus Heimdallarchaeaceae archaeon]
MNKKAKILSLIVLGVLIPSIYFSALTKAVVASDQLELTKGTTVTGKVLYSNSTVTDELLYYSTLTVEDIFNLTDVNLNVVQFKNALSIPSGSSDPLGFGDVDMFELTSLFFEHNRTTILPAARIFIGNATYTVEISVLGHGYTKYSQFMNLNNTYITFKNGTSYRYGDVEPGDMGYYDITMYMLIYAILNYGLVQYYKWTLWAISPTANVGDKINYVDTDSDVDALGTVIDMPAVTTSNGDSYDTIHVKYAYTYLFGYWDAPEVNAYYDAKTGMLLRVIESDGTNQYEFVPGEVTIAKKSLLPFPFAGAIVSFVAIGLIVTLVKKRKNR